MIRCNVNVNDDGTIRIPLEVSKVLDLSSGEQVTIYLDRNQQTELEPELIETLIREGIILDVEY